MTRRKDWQARLRAYLIAMARRRFRPGSHDCALFVAGAIREMTGEDLGKKWRGSYRSLAKGRAALSEAGYDDLASLAAEHLPEVTPIFAQPGDVAILRDAEGQEAMGLVQGAGIYVLRPDGLGAVPLTAAERAFRV